MTAVLMFLVGLALGVIAGAFIAWISLLPYLKNDL